jgi:dTDP-4-dehydrorhamnose 3,5-epimerase
MIFTPTPLTGAYVVEMEPRADERGFFARIWCRREFEEHGLDGELVQSSISLSKSAGTLRGLHYQATPFEETKLVRCTRGSIFDVIVDLRPESRTFTRHVAVRLSSANRRMLYIPKGFAHGFQTLEHDTEVMYQMSEFYQPEAARGVRWDDPAFAIDWPDAANRIMNERDRSYPDFRTSVGNGPVRS